MPLRDSPGSTTAGPSTVVGPQRDPLAERPSSSECGGRRFPRISRLPAASEWRGSCRSSDGRSLGAPTDQGATEGVRQAPRSGKHGRTRRRSTPAGGPDSGLRTGCTKDSSAQSAANARVRFRYYGCLINGSRRGRRRRPTASRPASHGDPLPGYAVIGRVRNSRLWPSGSWT